MQAALIVVAIFIALVLLMRYVAPASKPHFRLSERLPRRMLTERIRLLGRACCTVQSGFGVSYRAVCARRLLGVLEKSDKVCCNWRRVLIDNAETVISALEQCKSGVRSGVYLGHVDGYPRIFLFCKLLVEGSGGEISDSLFNEALDAFEENAELTRAERGVINDFLIFCIVGSLAVASQYALRRDNKYSDGVSDGRNCRMDLDSIRDIDYVCGILDGTAENDLTAVKQLLEYNNIDSTAAIAERRIFLAQMYSFVKGCLRSLAVVDGFVFSISNESLPHKPSIERRIKVCNYAMFVMIVGYAVILCFYPRRFSALFFVLSVLTYAGFRAPILTFDPMRAIDIFAILEKFFRRPKHNESADKHDVLPLSEIAYFGGETEYIDGTIGGKLKVRCDNRGVISIVGARVCDKLNIFVESDSNTVALNNCDGIVERHRTLYHAACGDIELKAVVFAPVDCAACIVTLTLINRGDDVSDISVCAILERERNGRTVDCLTKPVCGGAAIICNDGAAMFFSCDARFGGNPNNFDISGELGVFGTTPTLVGRADTMVQPFSAVERRLYIVYGNDERALLGIRGYVDGDEYYELAADCCAEFGRLDCTAKLPHSTLCDDSNVGKSRLIAMPYSAPERQNSEYLLSFEGGGIFKSGESELFGNLLREQTPHVLTNGILSIELTGCGISGISYCGKRITSTPTYIYMPAVYAVIGEGDLLWSPTAKPIGCGTLAVRFGYGYTEYICAYNGTISTLKCYVARRGGASVFELRVKNTIDKEREIDIMLSATCDGGVGIFADCENACRIRLGDCALKLSADGAAECCTYREGYFVRGKIDRAANFRVGGNTPAPTLSVKRRLSALGECLAVFELSDDGAGNIDFSAVECHYKRLGRIALDSDDDILNISYRAALYNAYTYGFLDAHDCAPRELYYLFGAIKYINPSAVKNRIIALLSNQCDNGMFTNAIRDCLYSVMCIIEYIELTDDRKFLREMLPFARTNNRDFVLEHMLLAVDCFLNGNYASDSPIERIGEHVIALSVLKFCGEHIELGNARCEQYDKALRHYAKKFENDVKYLKFNNFYVFSSRFDAYLCARLLYVAGENEKAYNILKYNNPLERVKHYKTVEKPCYDGPVTSALYYSTITEELLGARFCGKTVRLYPRTANNTPHIELDILGATRNIHVDIDDRSYFGRWKMRIGRISYTPCDIDLSDGAERILFYR